MSANERTRRPLCLELVSVLLTPFVLAARCKLLGTYKINQQQQKNAQIIAKAQMENATFMPSSLKDGIFTKETMIQLIAKYREEIDRNPYGEDLLRILTEKYNVSPSELGD